MSQSSALPSSNDNLRSRFPRVAIAHEWLTIPGGSEKVVLELLKLLPQAEIFTTVYDPEPWPEEITSRPVHTTFLNKIPGARKQYPKLLPLMDTAWRRFDLRGFDLIVSSNHACAKNVRVPAGVPHVCYCHTPMRYAWDTEFMAGERLGPAQRLAFKLMTPYLRRIDRRGAWGVDAFAANSSFVAERIALYYERKAAVVHPPVDVDRFLGNARTAGPDSPYLLFGRLVPYKKADVAVEACVRLGRPLRIAGDGRDMDRLRELANSSGTASSGTLPRNSIWGEPAASWRRRSMSRPSPAIRSGRPSRTHASTATSAFLYGTRRPNSRYGESGPAVRALPRKRSTSTGG